MFHLIGADITADAGGERPNQHSQRHETIEKTMRNKRELQEPWHEQQQIGRHGIEEAIQGNAHAGGTNHAEHMPNRRRKREQRTCKAQDEQEQQHAHAEQHRPETDSRNERHDSAMEPARQIVARSAQHAEQNRQHQKAFHSLCPP